MKWNPQRKHAACPPAAHDARSSSSRQRFLLGTAVRLFRLAAGRSATECQRLVAHLLSKLAALPDGHARRSAVFAAQTQRRLAAIEQELDRLLFGQLVFESTETWHRVYQDLLEQVQLRRYLSVALIKSDDYWHDRPSEHSLRLNGALASRGFLVHRIFIIDEFFWPRLSRTPGTNLMQWIAEQKQSGIEVSLVRREDLAHEPHLICDLGIYGDEAVGYQETDFEGRTVRFELRFDATSLQQAQQRWQELLLYAKPWSEVFS